MMARAVPRSLMDQTPDDLRASTKRKARTPQRPAPTRSVRVALDMSEMAGAAPLDDAADSDSDIEAVAMANPSIPPVPGRTTPSREPKRGTTCGSSRHIRGRPPPPPVRRRHFPQSGCAPAPASLFGPSTTRVPRDFSQSSSVDYHDAQPGGPV
jgi:hypothetical protein